MKTILAITALLAASVAAPAYAAADLEVTLGEPSGLYVDQSGTWDVVVENVGNRNANNVSLIIELPETNTSPNVYVMGVLGSFDSACSQVGTTLDCSLGRIRKGQAEVVSFDIALPYADGGLEVYASAATSSSESNTSNNDDSVIHSQLYYANAVAAPLAVVNEHCTGTALTSFYECVVSPGSVSSHGATFESNGDVTFPFATTVTGFWQQPTADTLTFQYWDNGAVVADFEGVGVAGGCWEGLTIFPASGYVAPYRICP